MNDLYWSKACVFDPVLDFTQLNEMCEQGRLPHREWLLLSDLKNMLTPIKINRKGLKIRFMGQGKRRRPVTKVLVNYGRIVWHQHALERLQQRHRHGSRLNASMLWHNQVNCDWLDHLRNIQIEKHGAFATMTKIRDYNKQNPHPHKHQGALNDFTMLVPYDQGAVLGYTYPSTTKGRVLFKEANQTPFVQRELDSQEHLFNAMTYIHLDQMYPIQREILNAVENKNYDQAVDLIRNN